VGLLGWTAGFVVEILGIGTGSRGLVEAIFGCLVLLGASLPIIIISIFHAPLPVLLKPISIFHLLTKMQRASALL
jgi:hypothetical protein